MHTKYGKDVSRIGIGSYGICGRGHRNMMITEKDEDNTYIDALAYTLNNGSNFTEISMGYGHGNSIVLFKRALDVSGVNREDVFITHSFYPNDIDSLATMDLDALEFYRIMETDYADSTLVTQSLIIQIGEATIYPWLHGLLASGKSRYVSLSNASPT